MIAKTPSPKKDLVTMLRTNKKAIGLILTGIATIGGFALDTLNTRAEIKEQEIKTNVEIVNSIKDNRESIEDLTESVNELKQSNQRFDDTQRFMNEVLYNMNPKAYNKTKLERKEKEL